MEKIVKMGLMILALTYILALSGSTISTNPQSGAGKTMRPGAFMLDHKPTDHTAEEHIDTDIENLLQKDDFEVFFNELEIDESKPMGYSSGLLESCDYCEMTKEELFHYYGIQFDVSALFPDLVEKGTEPYGIYLFPDGNDWKGPTFRWDQCGGSSLFCAAFSKGKLPLGCCSQGFPNIEWVYSSLGECDRILFSHYTTSSGEEVYCAEFMYRGLGFNLRGINMERDDFLTLVKYFCSL